MDNLTHTLFAVTLARTPLRRAGRGTLAALVVASNAPDVDIVAGFGGGATSYLRWHRGPTHGPLGVVALGCATAAIVYYAQRGLTRRRARPPAPDSDRDATFGMLLSVSIIGVLMHVLMDLPTSYGTRLLSPFTWDWFAFDWLPIVDIYLLVALAAGLVLGEMSQAVRHRFAAIVLALMAADYGVRASAHRQALTLAPRLFGSLLPQPCDRGTGRVGWIEHWPVQAATSTGGGACLIEMAAVPTFASPFRWRIIAHLSNGYELHDLDLLDARYQQPTNDSFWRRVVRYPDQWTPATVAAARTESARVFLGFSRFPAARAFVDPTGLATIRWSDMRFVGGMTMDSRRPPSMFNLLVRVAPDGAIRDERFGR